MWVVLLSVNYLLLCNKIPPNLWASNNNHLFNSWFCGSSAQAGVNWVFSCVCGSCWASWELGGWSGMTLLDVSCLWSMKFFNPHQYSLGLLKWQLLPREQSPGSVLMRCHFCHILFAKSSHRGSPDSKDREIDNTSGLEELPDHYMCVCIYYIVCIIIYNIHIIYTHTHTHVLLS